MASEPNRGLHARRGVSHICFSTVTLDDSTNDATTAVAVLMDWSRDGSRSVPKLTNSAQPATRTNGAEA